MLNFAKQSLASTWKPLRAVAGISVSRVKYLHSTPEINCSSVSKSEKNESSTQFRPPTAKMASMMDIGCRSLFGPEQDAFRETVRKFVQKEIVPHSVKWDERGYVDRSVWEKAGECGLLCVNLPEEHGGLGGSFAEAAIVMEELGYAGLGGPALYLHSDIIMPYVSKYGSDEQRKRYIPGATAGKIISSIAMTEPDAGSDLQGIKSFARKDGSDYVLNGSKMFISNGWLADLFVVVAVTNREAKSPAHGISLFLVDADTPGFKKGWLMKKMGQGSTDAAAIFFEDVRLPASARLGEENKGFFYLMNELPQERLCIGIHACAHAEFMFEVTKQYVMQRKAYGKTLSNLQTVQHKLAEMKTEICVTRAFIDQCIVLHENRQLDVQMACMAKIWASELENKIAAQCVQLHGGAGYIMDSQIARSYVHARVQTIYGGSNEVLKDLIARQIIMPPRK